MAQTFLTPSEVDQLVAEYEAGCGVQELAEKYRIHRATVFAHLRRREVPRRRPGLNDQEQAEAVRLSRKGMSMRAIGREMGVDRKDVRVALVEAEMIKPSRSIGSTEEEDPRGDLRELSESTVFCYDEPKSGGD